MRYAMFASAFALVAASNAGAQPDHPRRAMEPIFSPFTYEVLGATPSLRLHMPRPVAEKSAVAAPKNVSAGKAESKAPAREREAAAGFEDKGRAAQTTLQ